jgi:hypothetical protein
MNKSRDEHRGKDRSPTRYGGLQNISHVPQSQMSHGYTQPDGQEEIVTTELPTRPIFDHRSRRRLFGNDDPCRLCESSHNTPSTNLGVSGW